jgi:hypothetical protein
MICTCGLLNPRANTAIRLDDEEGPDIRGPLLLVDFLMGTRAATFSRTDEIDKMHEADMLGASCR